MSKREILDAEVHGWTVRELLELSFIAGYKEACDVDPTTILIDDYMDEFERVLDMRQTEEA